MSHEKRAAYKLKVQIAYPTLSFIIVISSTMEGGYAGVPMVVCPTFSDQPVNAAKLVKLKVALSVARPSTSGQSTVRA